MTKNIKKKEVSIEPFNISTYLKGGYRVATSSGLRVNILTTNSDEKSYKIKGFIGKSTQLETWTIQGKYYNKNKDIHYNDLTLIKNT